MKLGVFGRVTLAAVAALALGLSMTACGGGTVAFLWTPGGQYNQIAGYKVDDYSGNLTETIGSPYAIQGTNPGNMVVKVGGRYVYVLTKGTVGEPGTCTSASSASAVGPGPCLDSKNAGIDLYSVGNDGVLTFQQHYNSQGFVPVYLQMDSTGTYLYALDKYAPEASCPTVRSATQCPTGTTFNGAISVFSADADTGRLTIVTNQAVKDPLVPGNSTNLAYFPVGVSPQMLYAGASCVYTIDAGDQSVFPYVQGSGGQLTQSSNGAIATGATQLTSINGNGSSVFLTDANNGSTTNYILPYTQSGSCVLQSSVGGKVLNQNAQNPDYSFVDRSGNYLVVLNGFQYNSTLNTTPASSVTTYHLTSSSPPVYLNDPLNGVGSGPTCVVEDPTSKFLYISNYYDGTITGRSFDSTDGRLQQLSNGSTFQAGNKQLTCLALSGNVD